MIVEETGTLKKDAERHDGSHPGVELPFLISTVCVDCPNTLGIINPIIATVSMETMMIFTDIESIASK